METLAIEISKILNISFEKAIELLPVIRSQFIKYSIINSISWPINVIFILTSIFLFVVSLVFLGNKDYKNKSYGWSSTDENLSINSREILPTLVKAVIALGVLTMILSVSRYILAPDFMMLKQFILK